MKRECVEVRWDRIEGEWIVVENGGIIFPPGLPASSKADAIRIAAAQCRRQAKNGRHLELIIKNRNGRIGKGSSSRRTYSADPRSHKG